MKILAFILTRTWLLRMIAVCIAGLFVSWGVIKDGPEKSQVAETVLLLLVGGSTLLIEKKKSDDAAKAQADIGAKPDGWFGPKSRATIPGGEFNPNAEVRKPKPSRWGGNIKNGLIALALIPAFGLGGCADITPHTTVEHGKDGGYGFRKMTHSEAKAAGFTFIDRNSDQVWAWPILLMKGLYEFSK